MPGNIKLTRGLLLISFSFLSEPPHLANRLRIAANTCIKYITFVRCLMHVGGLEDVETVHGGAHDHTWTLGVEV